MTSCEKAFTFEDLCKKWKDKECKDVYHDTQSDFCIKQNNYNAFIVNKEGSLLVREIHDYSQTVVLCSFGTSFNKIDYIIKTLLEV